MMSCIKLVYNKIIIKWAVKIDQNCLYALFAYISESKARRILLNSVGDADSMGLWAVWVASVLKWRGSK